MPEISATEAARNFADLLDAIEHRGEHFTVTRRGRAIAQLHPMPHGAGADVKAALRRRRPDAAWAADLASTRGAVVTDVRP